MKIQWILNDFLSTAVREMSKVASTIKDIELKALSVDYLSPIWKIDLSQELYKQPISTR